MTDATLSISLAKPHTTSSSLTGLLLLLITSVTSSPTDPHFTCLTAESSTQTDSGSYPQRPECLP